LIDIHIPLLAAIVAYTARLLGLLHACQHAVSQAVSLGREPLINQ